MTSACYNTQQEKTQAKTLYPFMEEKILKAL